jgi:hypothetical protein
MRVNTYISEINQKEGINIRKIVKSFEKKLMKCFKLYEDNVGFEDYKMNDYDYIILYALWSYIKDLHIEEYLIIMYSYYKIEEFYFPVNIFKSKRCINILLETDIIEILVKLIKCDQKNVL